MQTTVHPMPTVAIGSPLEGGFYGGIVRIRDVLHAVIWSPKDGGETKGVWLGQRKLVQGSESCFDSISNTLAMADAGSKLAKWAIDLRLGGHDDWCLPARDVLELAYRHLKPNTYETACTFRDGDNASSVPAGYPYSEASPIVQTSVAAFMFGGPEAFDTDWYWSSTQYSESDAWDQDLSNGFQYGNGKKYEAHARAVRLIQLAP
jgi:hypothetical protein